MKVRILADFGVDEIDGKPFKRAVKADQTPTVSDKFGQLLVKKRLAREVNESGDSNDED